MGQHYYGLYHGWDGLIGELGGMYSVSSQQLARLFSPRLTSSSFLWKAPKDCGPENREE